MRLLIIGGGGREHALCCAFHSDDPSADIYCAPGNPGTAEVATNLSIPADDIDRVADAADAYGIDLTIIGPELPLAQGLADRLRAEGRIVFGPGAAAAELESSKAFAKRVMAEAGVRTAAASSFTDLALAKHYIERHAEPLVVKASGLAAGKGVIVCGTRREAIAAVTAMLGEGAFGAAGRVVVVEDFLEGEELSILAVTNGKDVVLLPPCQDHKRLGEGDTGPNTGGMGAYSPVSLASPELLDKATEEILLPTLAEMRRRRTPFVGALYAGLMVDASGTLSVIEFNCRLGDPETQATLPLVTGGLTELFWSAAKEQKLPPISFHSAAAVTTVLASRGYPGKPERGAAIRIPHRFAEGVTLFHAGTSQDADGILRVGGGRVLNVTAVAPTFIEAQARSRRAAEQIEFEGKIFRRDIGWREAARLSGVPSSAN